MAHASTSISGCIDKVERSLADLFAHYTLTIKEVYSWEGGVHS